MIKDRYLRDNPPAIDDDPPQVRRLGQRQTYSNNRPEGHEVIGRWRRVADEYDPPAVLLGETWILNVPRMAAYYGTGRDQLDLAFNFPFMFARLEAAQMRDIVELTEASLPPGAWPAWTGSNHDVLRFPSRWCAGDDRKSRCALMLLLSLRGTPVIYYGDEIGMLDVAVSDEQIMDGMGKPGSLHYPGRDAGRTPMQWNRSAGAGFTSPEVKPWLPFGLHEQRNVDDQRADPGSMLHLCRDLIALRNSSADLSLGGYATLPGPPGAWVWRRGDATAVAVNLSDGDVTVDSIGGTVAIGTDRSRDGERVGGKLRLDAWQGAIVELA